MLLTEFENLDDRALVAAAKASGEAIGRETRRLHEMVREYRRRLDEQRGESNPPPGAPGGAPA